MIVAGTKQSESSDEYASSSTEEQCYILEIIDSEVCTKYRDYRYQYSAMAFDKCGNITLFSEYDDCGKDKYAVDTEKTCYVLDCDKKEFSFNNSSKIKSGSNVLLICGIIFGIITFILAAGTSYVGCKKCDPDVYETRRNNYHL